MVIAKQLGLLGYDKFIGDTRQKMEHLYENHPEVFDSEKLMMLEYWEFFEHLDDILGDKYQAFRQWFLRCTSPETLTRCHRLMKEDNNIFIRQS
jgi:hypothetical protein